VSGYKALLLCGGALVFALLATYTAKPGAAPPGGPVLIAAKTGAVPDGGPQLIAIDEATGRVYGRWPLPDGVFAIEFIHSVNNTPVRETFQVREGRIYPVALRFYGFGAGMPSDLEPGQCLERDGDAMVITGFTRSFGELNYIVGTVSDHLLYINDEAVSLRDRCGKNAHLRIKAEGPR
jgi:hypothetical protein